MLQRCYGDDAAEEWSTSLNWEEGPAVNAERREISKQEKIQHSPKICQ